MAGRGFGNRAASSEHAFEHETLERGDRRVATTPRAREVDRQVERDGRTRTVRVRVAKRSGKDI